MAKSKSSDQKNTVTEITTAKSKSSGGGKVRSFIQFFGIALTTSAIVAFTLYAWKAELEKEAEQVSTEFHEIGTSYINQVTTQIDVTMEILPTTSLYSNIAGGLSQDSFFEFSRELFDRYSAIGSLGWAPLVEKSEVTKTEAARIEEGFPGYKMVSVGSKPLASKPFYLPVTYMEFSRSHDYRPDDLSWMGLDITSHEEWSNAMDWAIDNNEIAFSLGLNEPLRIIAFYPVYLPNSETVTREERRSNLAGYVVAQLDPQKAVDLALAAGDQTIQDLATLRLLDVSKKPVVLYKKQNTAVTADNELAYNQAITIFGRTWRFELIPTPKFLQSKKIESIANWILAGGFLLAALTLFSLISMATRNKRIEIEVKQRTEELVEAHSQLRESEAMLMQSEKMSALGQMVAGVAHELNTPLGYVRSNLEVIHDHFGGLNNMFSKVIQGQVKRSNDGSKGVVQNLVEKINEDVDPETMGDVCKDSLDGIDHLSNIVTTLKSFSRMDQVEFETNSIAKCMESSLVIGHNQYKHKVEIVKNFEDVPDIMCNASEINQVFLNLILNAADAIEDFGTIHINIKPEQDGVSISIIDSGAGIPEDIRNKIFEPFYTTKDVGKGTGLGLFICNRIVTAHGGKIEVMSADGQGTEFRIYLPMTPPVKAVA